MSSFLHYPLSQITSNQSIGLTTDGSGSMETPFFAVEQNNQLYVYRNKCPHLGIPLEWMPDQFLDQEGVYIQCSTHGALFRVDNGLCVSGPCQGDSLKKVPFHTDENSLIISTEHLE